MLAMHRSVLRRRLTLSVTAVALTAASPTFAQTVPAKGDESAFQMLGRLIFGAGSAKVAIDTPQAVTVLEQTDFDRSQPALLSDVFKGVPGVAIAGASARPLGQSFNIRGIGNAEQAASEERIKVSVDGAPKFFEQYRMGSFFGDLELFKRVEVLRGPASATLNGSGAIGGAINFTTKDASDFLAEGESTVIKPKLSYSSNGDGRKEGVIFAQRKGPLEYLVALNHSEGGEMKDGDGAILAGTAHESWSGLLKGKVAFGQDASQSLTFSLSKTDTNIDDALVGQTGGAASAFFGTADIHAIDTTLALTWNNSIPDNDLLDVTVQLSYTDTDVTKDNFSLGAACAPGSNQVLCDGEFGYKTTALKIENKADFSAGAWENTVIAGLQFSTQDRSATSSLGPMGFHPEGTDNKLGVYAQGEFVWNDKLTLIPGVRVDFGNRTPSGASAAQGATDSSDQAASIKLQAMYEFNDNFGIFGTLARTERMPTLDELYSYGVSRAGFTQVPALDLKKESANTTELGLTYKKEGLFTDNDSLQLKATAFNNNLSDLIAANTTGGNGSPAFININRAKIWGGELEAAYDSEKWFANMSWSKVRSQNRSAGAAYGTTLADTPSENLSFTLGAKLPEQGLTIGWRGNWYSSITTASATTSAPAYNVHDIFVVWQPKEGVLRGMDVGLTVENVFDTKYRNNLALDNGPGRNAKLSVGKSFTW